MFLYSQKDLHFWWDDNMRIAQLSNLLFTYYFYLLVFGQNPKVFVGAAATNYLLHNPLPIWIKTPAIQKILSTSVVDFYTVEYFPKVFLTISFWQVFLMTT